MFVLIDALLYYYYRGLAFHDFSGWKVPKAVLAAGKFSAAAKRQGNRKPRRPEPSGRSADAAGESDSGEYPGSQLKLQPQLRLSSTGQETNASCFVHPVMAISPIHWLIILVVGSSWFLTAVTDKLTSHCQLPTICSIDLQSTSSYISLANKSSHKRQARQYRNSCIAATVLPYLSSSACITLSLYSTTKRVPISCRSTQEAHVVLLHIGGFLYFLPLQNYTTYHVITCRLLKKFLI